MKVHHGWSGEFSSGKWAKFDVELDETDLMRMLHEADIDMTHPHLVKERHAFMLLQAEAEVLLLLKMMSAFSYPEKQGRARIEEILVLKHDVVTKIRDSVPARADD